MKQQVHKLFSFVVSLTELESSFVINLLAESSTRYGNVYISSADGMLCDCFVTRCTINLPAPVASQFVVSQLFHKSNDQSESRHASRTLVFDVKAIYINFFNLIKKNL